ncbi:MAG: hypothetical protein CVU05_09420 [Bacteroidetes bacterium HGW-Bacteroidetes-21]|nr:MAG: hypothetical protein CVU05_09420 [Bacteroidetes bacterium HGW-Bacteroidetes-21]
MKVSIRNPYIYILFFALSLLLYGNSIRNGYALDDEFVVRNNTLVQQGAAGIPEIFTSPYYASKEWSFGYRPLTKATYALEYELYGENLFMHHLINVLLYIICACLIFYVFSVFFDGKISAYFWMLVTLLFIAHPVHTEVVASLKNREEILCLIFSLLSFSSFFKFIDRKSVLGLLSGLIFLILAFLSKQTAVVMVLLIPAMFIIREMMRGNSWPSVFRSYRVYIILLLGLIVTYVFFKIPQWFLPAEQVDLLSFENPLHVDNNYSNSFFLAFYSLWIYIKLLVFPHPLLYYYGMYVIPEPSLSNIVIWISFIVSGVLLTYSLLKIRKSPVFALGLSIIFLSLLPFVNIFIPLNGIVAERMLFLPVLGYAIIIVWLLYLLNKSLLANNNMKGKRTIMVWVIFMGLIFTFSGKTISRNKDWKSSPILFNADMPYLDASVKANDIYATAVFDEVYKQVTAGKKVKDMEKKLMTIVHHYERTLELYPDNPKAEYNLSTIFLSFYHDAPKALLHAEKARLMDPGNFKIFFNLGQAFQMLQKKDSAEYYYRMAADKEPSFEQAWQSIILLYAELRQPDSLRPYVIEFQKIYPKSDYGWAALGAQYVSLGDTVRGIECFENAIAIKPQEKEKIIPIWKYYMKKGNLLKTAYYQKLLDVAK